MRNIIILASFSLLFLIGCDEDFLDKTPTDQLSGPTFWNTENDLILAANNLYRALPGFSLDTRSYLFAPKRAFNNISDGSYVPTQNFGSWEASYGVIRDANFLLENADNAANSAVGQEIIKRYKAEGLFFRAWAYYDLVRSYGDVPFITTTLNLESPELLGPREDRTMIIDAILADLQTASEDLPAPSELEASEHGRITSSAAIGLRARIALYEGTRGKYHGYGTPTEHLQVAKNAANDLIGLEGSEHELFNSRENLFLEGMGGETSSEAILVRKYGGEIDHSYSLLLRNADIVPTKAFADMYLDNTGLPITDPGSSFLGYDEIDSEFQNRDPRMISDFMIPLVEGFFSGSDPTIPDLNENNPTSTGYVAKKGLSPETLFRFNERQDRIVFRYAEVLLIYAEASFELDGSINDAELDKSINKLRARVGMPSLTNAFVATNGLDMLAEIRRERTIELAQEGQEWDDGIRWKIAEIEQPKALKGFKFQPENYPTIAVSTIRTDGQLTVDADGFLVYQDAQDRVFDPGKHYLFPIPLREIDLNSENIQQNPNW